MVGERNEPAWSQDEVGQVGQLRNVHDMFLSNSETLTGVHVRIVHAPSATIVVDETYDVVDVSRRVSIDPLVGFVWRTTYCI